MSDDKELLNAAKLHSKAVGIIASALREMSAMTSSTLDHERNAAAIIARLANANILLDAYESDALRNDVYDQVAWRKSMSEGWIRHDGGPRPCKIGLLVEVVLKNGDVTSGLSESFGWGSNYGDTNIVMWRPAIETQPDEANQALQRLHDQMAEQMRQRKQKADETEDDGFAVIYGGQVLGLLDALNMVKDAMGEQDNAKV